MKKFLFALALMATLTGCNTAGKAVESASAKSIVGDGWIALNKITITDSTTNSYTPQLFSLFVTGRYVSLLKGAQALYYDKKESSSTFNSSAKTTEEYLIIQIKDGGDMTAVLNALANLNKTQVVKENLTTETATAETATAETK